MTKKEFNTKLKSEYNHLKNYALHSTDAELKQECYDRLFKTYNEYYKEKINKKLSYKQYNEAEANVNRATQGKTQYIADDIIKKRNDIIKNTEPENFKTQYDEAFKSTWVKNNRDYVDTETFQIEKKTNAVKSFENYIEQEDMLMYVAVMDERTRDDHRELDGTILPASDPFWTKHTPPWDYNCFDKETEVFTNNGWKLFKDLHTNDLIWTINPETRIPEFQKPVNYFSKKYTGKMIGYKSSNCNFLVTPDHQMCGVKSWDRREGRTKLSFVNASKIPSEFLMYKTSNWIGEEPEFITICNKQIKIEDYIEFMGWYLSEGNSNKRKEQESFYIKITQEKHFYEDIKKLCERLPFDFYYGKGYIGSSNKELALYLMQFGKSYEKFIPEEIKKLSPRLLKLFIDTYTLGDGCITSQKKGEYICTHKSIYTSSKRMTSDLTEIFIKAGFGVSNRIHSKKGKLSFFKRNNKSYSQNHDVIKINILLSEYHTIIKENIFEQYYNDMVYCVEVPNHTLLIKREGSIVWCGNCRCTVVRVNTDKEVRKDVQTEEVEDLDVNPHSPRIFTEKHNYMKYE